MFFIEKLSKSIVSCIYKNTILDKDELEIIEYGALITILQMIGLSLVIILGFIFGIPYQVLTFYFTACMLRKYSGGIHSDSPNRCIIIGTFISIFIPLIIDKFYVNMIFNFIIFLQIISLIFCYFIILKLAPVDSIEKPITSENLKKHLKNKSILAMIISTILIIILIILYIHYKYIFLLKVSQCIIFACVWQCYTLTQFGHKVMRKVDNILKYIYEVIKNEKQI